VVDQPSRTSALAASMGYGFVFASGAEIALERTVTSQKGDVAN
jgi:hypothetical protein